MTDVNMEQDGNSPAAQNTVDEEIESAVKKRISPEERKKIKARRIKIGAALIPILLIGYGFHWLFQPYMGGISFGFCKVFLELNVEFPQTLELKYVEEFETSVRIWFTHVNAFGEYRMEQVQCYYQQDETNGIGFSLEKIVFNRNFEIDAKTLHNFNMTLPTIAANPPDLALPYSLYDSLEGITFETDKYRKPIL